MPLTDSSSSERDKELKTAFGKIKKELNDHLETLNQNTVEIESNFEYLERLEARIEKLNEKLEELTLLLRARPCEEVKANKIKLSGREQEVFLLLYTSNEFMSYGDIAKKLGLTVVLAGNYLTSMIEKGIPLMKRYVDKQPAVMLDPSFREKQAKQGIV
jgi:DNA-directed RNA polymerase specialized sigma subunit